MKMRHHVTGFSFSFCEWIFSGRLWAIYFYFPPKFWDCVQICKLLFVHLRKKKKETVSGWQNSGSFKRLCFFLTDITLGRNKSMQSTFSNLNIEFIEFFMEIYRYWILYFNFISGYFFFHILKRYSLLQYLGAILKIDFEIQVTQKPTDVKLALNINETFWIEKSVIGLKR